MNENRTQAFWHYLKTRRINRTNYYLIEQKELAALPAAFPDRKPKLLLHACCAVCASWPLELLTQYFDVSIFFNNSNIYPQTEYDRRLAELKRFIQETGVDVECIETPYHYAQYVEQLRPMKDDPEGFGRCWYCYAVRMREAYQYASDHGFDFFTTVMSISRQKDSCKINEIGRSLSHLFPDVSYFFSDFKKGNGQTRQRELVQAHDLYRQDYCGCEFTIRKQD